MSRQLENEDKLRVPAYFSTRPQDVYGAEELDVPALVSELTTQCDSWQSCGSNFTIEHIVKFVVRITKYRPLHGSSFIETPRHIANKYCTINIHNHDQKYFLWSILAHLHPIHGKEHPNRIHHYKPYEDTLNVDGLSFPLQTKHIPKLESQNPTISINVLPFIQRLITLLSSLFCQITSFHILPLIQLLITVFLSLFLVTGCFAPLTFRPSRGRFAPSCGHIAPWTIRHQDGSLSGRFVPWTIRHLDISPTCVGQFAPKQ